MTDRQEKREQDDAVRLLGIRVETKFGVTWLTNDGVKPIWLGSDRVDSGQAVRIRSMPATVKLADGSLFELSPELRIAALDSPKQ